MVIEVNIETCLQEGLTASQFVFLSLLWQKKVNTALAMRKIDPDLHKSLPNLVERGYLMTTDKSFIIDRKKCNELFGVSEDSDFWEFFSTFPLKVNSKGASRALRALDPNSKNAMEARAKYKDRVKSKAMHRHVMACLNAEMEQRRRSGSLQYMQNILTWLNQRTWQMSEYLLQVEQPKVEPRHGEGLV